jgi:hypothetical protein
MEVVEEGKEAYVKASRPRKEQKLPKLSEVCCAGE